MVRRKRATKRLPATKKAQAPARRKQSGIAERLMKIAKESAPLWKEPFRSMTQKELDDLLYDDRGLPRED